MQLLVDSYVCGINMSSESILIVLYYFFSCNTHVPVGFWNTFIMRKVNLKIQETFLKWYLYQKGRTDGLILTFSNQAFNESLDFFCNHS